VKSINTIIISNLKFYKSIEKMSVKNIMLEIEGLIKNTVMSCASLYGFSAEEALAKIDANGNLIKAVVDKAAEKAEKQRLKEAEKAEKQRQKEAEKQEKEALAKQQKEAEKIQKEAEKQEKEAEKLRLKEALVVEKLRLKEALEAERSSMKEEEVLSKAAEKQALKQAKEAEKALVKEKKPAKKVKKVAVIDEPVVISPSKEDDDCFVLFQNIPLMNEINSIRDVKKFKNYKKLSTGVKLARQIMDI